MLQNIIWSNLREGVEQKATVIERLTHCIQGQSFVATALGQSFSSETLGVVVWVGHAVVIASTWKMNNIK